MRTKAIGALKKIQNEIGVLSVEVLPLWHPLGFVSCVVFKENNIVTRLHYWPKDERKPKKPNWPIHTHIFKLSSLILSGSLRDVQYHRFPGNDYAAYQVQYMGEDSILVEKGEKCRIGIVRDSILYPHGFYYIEEGVFHESKVDLHQETLTLAQCFEYSSDEPIVLAPVTECAGSDVSSLQYIRQPYNSGLFWERVGSLIDVFLRSEDFADS